MKSALLSQICDSHLEMERDSNIDKIDTMDDHLHVYERPHNVLGIPTCMKHRRVELCPHYVALKIAAPESSENLKIRKSELMVFLRIKKKTCK